jgi:hypothetical protein
MSRRPPGELAYAAIAPRSFGSHRQSDHQRDQPFIISRRLQDEIVSKKKVEELEQQVLKLLDRLEQYRQRVAEILARQQ